MTPRDSGDGNFPFSSRLSLRLASWVLVTPPDTLYEAGTDPIFVSNMGDGTGASLLADFFSQPHGHRMRRPDTLSLSVKALCQQRTKTSFVQHQLDHLSLHRHIAFEPGAHVVLFDA